MLNCVVVIPIHKINPSKEELISFEQCFKVLDRHPIKVLAPRNLNIASYKKVVPQCEIIFIDPICQSSFREYNNMKMNGAFYKLFTSYKFLLTYELDAWVFKDELEYWCNKDYDYIGAPWFEGLNMPTTNKIIGVGNSGFSLRSISASIRILRRVDILRRVRKFWFKSHIQAIIRFSTVLSILKAAFKIDNYNSLNWALVQNDLLEDFFWSQVVAKAFSDYKVASIGDAIKFSFEVNPAHLYEIANYQLPFGCHAWNVYDPVFWKQFIKA